MYRDFPPLYNIDRERRKLTQKLLDDKIENALQTFYDKMNETAARIGMKNSNFASSHGGINLPDNYSTAHDIALLGSHVLMKHDYLK